MGLDDLLHRDIPVVLDGATATEMQRHGVSVKAPWWTSIALVSDEGRRLLRQVHASYIAAGAEVITANTFRTNQRALERADAGPDAVRLVHAAVDEARRARDMESPSGGVYIAASMAPVEDCYQPDMVPPDAELYEEHGWLARAFADSGVDVALIETMNSVREARIALECCKQLGLPAWVSFVCEDGSRLLSGEPLAEAAQAVEEAGADAVLVNCVPLKYISECLQELKRFCSLPTGAYPNVEDRTAIADWQHVEHYVDVNVSPDELAGAVTGWQSTLGMNIAGGCCGTTPAHITALRQRLGLGRSVEDKRS